MNSVFSKGFILVALLASTVALASGPTSITQLKVEPLIGGEAVAFKICVKTHAGWGESNMVKCDSGAE